MLVTPLLKYRVQFWGSHFQKEVEKLKRVQKRIM